MLWSVRINNLCLCWHEVTAMQKCRTSQQSFWQFTAPIPSAPLSHFHIDVVWWCPKVSDALDSPQLPSNAVLLHPRFSPKHFSVLFDGQIVNCCSDKNNYLKHFGFLNVIRFLSCLGYDLFHLWRPLHLSWRSVRLFPLVSQVRLCLSVCVNI